MKTILILIIGFGLLLNLNAQNMERISFKINKNVLNQNTLSLDPKLKINKGLYADLTPQFGNQFISRNEAKSAKLDLKEFYEDFDFGFNMGFNYIWKKQLQLKAIYNFGLLKFEESVNGKVNSCILKLSIDYVF